MRAAHRPDPAPSGQAGGLGTSAPAMLVPLRFMLAGILALFGGVAMLALWPALLTGYHYNQHIVAVTHLFVLGWILTIVMGATYQLVPVALETRLYSERLARWQFLLHVVGCAGMVAMFWRWNMTALGHYGSVLAAGAVLYAYNMVRTLLRVPRWTVVATAVASSLAWMLLAMTAGLMITAGKCVYSESYDSALAKAVGPVLVGLQAVGRLAARFDQISAMHAHAHLGAVGVFGMLIVGVSYKLVPMFTLGEVRNATRAKASIALLNAGLAASFLGILLRSPLKLCGALLIAAGLACYGFELRAILRTRKRPTLDWGMRYFVTAIAMLAPVSALAIVLAWPGLPLTPFTGRLENLYGFLGFAGVVSFAIIGMLYKILPFLIWFRSYSGRVGRAKVPALGDLYSAGLQQAGYWTYVGGLLGTAAGILVSRESVARAGCWVLALSAGILLVNAGRILAHLFRPRIEPLAAPPSAAVLPVTANLQKSL